MASTLPAATAFTGATVTEGLYKQAMTDLRTYLNDPDTYQWFATGLTPTYISTTGFSLVGDQTAAFHVGRRIRCVVTSGTIYGRIATSAFSGITTITIAPDSGVLDSGLSTIYLGAATLINPGVPYGMVVVDRKVASASPTIDFGTISNALYDSYMLMCDSVIPATNATTLRMRISIAGIFQTGLIYTHNHFRFTATGSGTDGSASDSSACISSSAQLMSNANPFFSEIKISNCVQATVEKHWLSKSSYVSSTIDNIVDEGGGRFATGSAIDGFRLYMSAGNITSGTFTLYGFRK